MTNNKNNKKDAFTNVSLSLNLILKLHRRNRHHQKSVSLYEHISRELVSCVGLSFETKFNYHTFRLLCHGFNFNIPSAFDKLGILLKARQIQGIQKRLFFLRKAHQQLTFRRVRHHGRSREDQFYDLFLENHLTLAKISYNQFLPFSFHFGV